MNRVLAADGASAPLTIERVLLCTLLLILFVVILEAGLHKLTHACKRHHKYYEMLNKTTGELMIVGLIYVLVKATTYVGAIQSYGVEYYSMDAADMLIFFVALFLVAQSLVIFTRLRSSNSKMDSLSITTASGLLHMAKETEDVMAAERAWWCRRRRATGRLHRLCEHKLLEAFFRESYELPSAFSFAKYIREIQDSQIVDLIEIDFTTWTLLLVLMASFFGCTGELQAHSVYRNHFHVDSDEYIAAEELEHKRFVVFGVFASTLTIAMTLMLLYLRRLNHALVLHAQTKALGLSADPEGYATSRKATRESLLEAIRALSISESNQPPLTSNEAITQMRIVSEKVQKGVKHRHGFLAHNLLVQLLLTCFRFVTCARHAKSANTLHAKNADLRLPLPFSRKAAQFFLHFFLIVNGLYYGMLLTCVVPALHGTSPLILLPLVAPLLLNTFVLAPRLVRHFALLDGAWQVDPTKLSRVIDHLSEVEELKGAMVEQINKYLADTNQDTNDIKAALLKLDADDGVRDGYVDIDAFRSTLNTFGFKFSRHKFHTLVLLEYETRGPTVKYEGLLNALTKQPEVTVV
ncbi:hypothetical protein SDRG_11295 [Saprolegnia diclina VS20]|uniref:EF-hand domain-containing protein n=1 Tax=Saprolegnia diclina (strain VS20) TaxID=1156394 RepID=T0QC31_SAPDV|nr:hypothetical protein SDRG_11295 [Saprolegnia diclina VS20]EQC31110.1 hypothetical protein SDRG_11295 [Saprolegnia diclina VS20]|eukprot:XP_008615549.1 hypothetical protein SDRG_11295 [Saprolegnia diclina VS20]